MLIAWAKFFICAAMILIFGVRLSKSAERIVSMGKLSEGLMGVLVLAAITSFPEVWTSIASIVRVNAIDLGVGDLIGSVIINLMIITILDFKSGRSAVLSTVKRYHLITCAFSLLMLGTFIAALSLYLFKKPELAICYMGAESFLLIIIYILGIGYTHRYSASEREPELHDTGGLRHYIDLSVSAIIIIISGFWLAVIGKEIVVLYGWNEMYFGTMLIALTTSLPEIVVSMAAVSIGSPNMAVANILGSNLFNMLIIPLADALYRKGPILRYVAPAHIYSAFLAILLTLIFFGGILYRPKRTFFRLGISTIILLISFIAGNILLFNTIRR